MQKKITNCSLDCFDCCSIEAYIEDDKVVKLSGNKNHPFTEGFICSKGRAHLDRTYHKERILTPKLKVDGLWTDISYDRAFDILAHKLTSIREDYGASSVLHYYDSGYGGLSKNVDKMFFNYYGNVTRHTGTLCWGAGKKAQVVDFGRAISNSPKQLLHSDTIIIWGRNPADTNIHMLKYLIEARKKGAKLILIDPIKTNTAKYCDQYIQIKPSTDGALALGIAKYLIDSDKIDREFINKNVHGFERFKDSLSLYTTQYVAKVTGIDEDIIADIAENYGNSGSGAIIIGYGMQRYKQGGNATRAINSLASITGNIGNVGGGVYYCNKSIGEYISGETDKSENRIGERRTYTKTKLADFLLSSDIKMLFITKANPILQVPDINKSIEAFKKVGFKVAVDLFMTDTAELCDLVIPATTVLEEEDFFYSSMFSPYLNYSDRVIEPVGGIMSEYDFYQRLAEKVELNGYPCIDRDEYFKRELAPLMETFDLDYEELKAKPFIVPDNDIAFKDLVFNTPSKKIELYSDIAKELNSFPIPTYKGDMSNKQYPLRLITPHAKDSLHSQHMMDNSDMPYVYINHNTEYAKGFNDGETVYAESDKGKIRCILQKSDRVAINCLLIYQGWWIKNGAVNILTTACISDIGEQAAYYECFCRITPTDKKFK